jgi:hypothetical protein
MLPGKTVFLAGETYVVPELNFQALQEQRELMKEIHQMAFYSVEELKKQIDFATAAHFLPVVHAAIKRNYPDVTLEKLQGGLGMTDLRSGEFFKALVAAMNPEGDKPKLGEEPAVVN